MSEEITLFHERELIKSLVSDNFKRQNAILKLRNNRVYWIFPWEIFWFSQLELLLRGYDVQRGAISFPMIFIVSLNTVPDVIYLNYECVA